jgi:hypothetical protein
VRNLFSQAVYDLDVVHKIEHTFPGDVPEGKYREIKVLSRWANDSDCFYSTVFSLMSNGDRIMINFAVYVKFSKYTLWWPVGRCQTSQDVFEWLDNPSSLKACIELSDYIVNEIECEVKGY